MTALPILPGSTIGVVGGGQLGRMLALEARRMGYRTVLLDPAEDSPGAQVADSHIRAPLNDLDGLRRLADRSDVVTLEWENADAEALLALNDGCPIRPGPHVLAVAQHRLKEKDTARSLGLPTADYRAVTSEAELHAAIEDLGTPSVLKTCRGGYDARGQRVLRRREDAAPAYAELGRDGRELVLESWVPFRIEASVICARNPRGAIACFPISENVHRNGILDFTLAPARISPALEREARQIGEALVEGLDVVGLLAVELFVDGQDRLYVNEYAPRPHNSGHYSWEACTHSQFEMQLRAVCDLPLPEPRLLSPACMANLLGSHIGIGEKLPGSEQALAIPGLSLHLYGKRSARPGRKMGHLTMLAATVEEAFTEVARARDILSDSYLAAQPLPDPDRHS
jgi:5-(carboxyamino)imidazole ribonucleotide synthase